MADGSAAQESFVSKKYASNAKRIYESLVESIKGDMKFNNPTAYAVEDRADSRYPERVAGDLITKLMSGRLRYANPVVENALAIFESTMKSEEYVIHASLGTLDRIYRHVGMVGPNKSPDARKGCL